MSTFFTDYIDKKLNITIPEDFLTLSAKAMAQLKNNERSNVLYNLAKGLGTPRLTPDFLQRECQWVLWSMLRTSL